MKLLKPAVFILILLSGLSLIATLILRKTNTPFESSLAPFFQLIGEPFKAVNVAATKVLPIDEMDEMEYGNSFALERYSDTTDADYRYVNKLLKSISRFSRKPFSYHAFIYYSSDPNAFALPGGIIYVTEGLLMELRTEGQIVSVLAHEMGHIECGHCFCAVKFELAARKLNISDIGQFVDFLNDFFLHHSYSKTQEAEADAFAYKTLLQTNYSPSSMAGAFFRLQEFEKKMGDTSSNDGSAEILRDYFMSHPPLPLRIAKYEAEAKRWWKTNSTQRRYIGKKNLKQRIAASEKSWDDEWATAQTSE